MLEDRYYMRRPGFGLAWSATVVLLAANVVAFVVQNIFEYYSSFPTRAWFALSVEGLRHGWGWQLLTYQFMHGGVLHLLFNCLAIYFIGPDVEETLGRPRFLTLYFSSGVVGGLFQALAGMLLGGIFGAPTLGASAGAFGLVAAFATLYPERPLVLLPLPIHIRAKFLLLFSALLAVFGIVFPRGDVAHAAHLGGMITGILFVRYAVHWHWPRLPRFRRPPLRPPAKVPRRASGLWPQSEGGADEDMPPEEFLSKEVDPILDKISAHGIQSLTERERRILQTAREKMVRR